MSENIIYDAVLGLAVGDALGVPVEFMRRDDLSRNPVLNMREHGTHNQPRGTWSDDTSMTLCLADSLSFGLDYTDIMDKFQQWVLEGQYTPHGEVFDIGNATRQALLRYTQGTPSLLCGGTEEYDCGNGSLMRILPAAFYLYYKYGKNIANKESMDIIHNVSSLTHRHPRCHIACGIYTHVAVRMLSGDARLDAVRGGIDHAVAYYFQYPEYRNELHHFSRLQDRCFKDLNSDSIRSSGYVIDTLEAALWCLVTTQSYEECVIKAVNLGEDTDTVAAVAGGLAGLYYRQIPETWINALVKKEIIRDICDQLLTKLKSVHDRIYAFLPYLENVTKDSVCTWKSNKGSLAYPDYDKRFLNFIEYVGESDLIDYEYNLTLEKYEVVNRDNMKSKVLDPDLDLTLAKAMLTSLIRQERFSDGSWAAAADDQLFYHLIVQIKRLMKE